MLTMNKITDFAKGVIAGALIAIVIFCIIAGLTYFNKRDKELIEYAEKQQAIEALREDYANRDPVEFLDVPGVRGAVDGAAAEFERKRDKALQRFRSRIPD
jgi:hypothetical protein